MAGIIFKIGVSSPKKCRFLNHFLTCTNSLLLWTLTMILKGQLYKNK